MTLLSIASNLLTDTWTVTKEYTYQPVVAQAYTSPDAPVTAQNAPESTKDPILDNCYLYVQSRIPELPRTRRIENNTPYPNVGGVVILKYNGVPHYAYIEKVLENGIYVSETNYNKGEYSERLLTWEYLEQHDRFYWRKD